MSFPDRIARDDLGPTMVDEFPVTFPNKEVGQQIYNLMFWQLAGCNLVVPRLVVIAKIVGTTVSTVQQLAAFDPKGELSNFAWSRNGVGDYTIDLGTNSFPNHAGASKNLNLEAGEGEVSNRTARRDVAVEKVSATQWRARIFDGAGSAAELADTTGRLIVKFW